MLIDGIWLILSFRRTALTQMSNAGIPLRVIQEISGHRNLDELQKYLEVTTEQVRGAVSSLSMLGYVGKEVYDGLESDLGQNGDLPTVKKENKLSDNL